MTVPEPQLLPLEVEDLTKAFKVKASSRHRANRSRRSRSRPALDGVSFRVHAGEILYMPARSMDCSGRTGRASRPWSAYSRRCCSPTRAR